MTHSIDTLIVGGGMAGIACGLKLREAGINSVMITDSLGGRTCYDRNLKMNFGAVFYMENYHHVKKILTPGPLLMTSYSQVMCHRSETDYFGAVSIRMLRNIFQLITFKRFMKEFVTHYETYKKSCETHPVKEALEKDPFMKRLYFKSAGTLIKELGVGNAADDLVAQFVFGCTGTDVNGLNALDFCNCAQGLVMPIYGFSFNEAAIEKKLGTVIRDRVVSVGQNNGKHTVVTEKGETYTANRLVLATPATVTKELIGLSAIRESSRLMSYLVQGIPRPKYRKHDIHVFSDTHPLIFFYHRQNGKNEYELFSVNDVDLSRFFDSHSVLGKKSWLNALYVKGDIILDQDLGNGLYIAGDHNGLGMEPAAISGIFAANRILGINE
jgi:hypothetical protein